jgi:hypothetical protein
MEVCKCVSKCQCSLKLAKRFEKEFKEGKKKIAFKKAPPKK